MISKRRLEEFVMGIAAPAREELREMVDEILVARVVTGRDEDESWRRGINHPSFEQIQRRDRRNGEQTIQCWCGEMAVSRSFNDATQKYLPLCRGHQITGNRSGQYGPADEPVYVRTGEPEASYAEIERLRVANS